MGAGASGIALAKAFRRRGCRSLKVLDKASTIGGHWGWVPNYVGVGVQNKREAYRYSDMPMEGASPRASARDCVEYLHGYAERHQLLGHVQLGQEVTEIVAARHSCGPADGDGQRQIIRVRDVATGEQVTHSADIIILAAGITPFLPPAVAAAAAAETDPAPRRTPLVRHSSQLDASLIREAVDAQLRVVIVGGGKSASECVAALRDASHPASLIQCVASSPSTCAGFEPQLWPHALQRPILGLFSLSCRLAARSGALPRWLARVLRWPLFWMGVLVASPVGGGCWRTLNGQVMTRRLVRQMRGVRATRGRLVGLGERSVLCSAGEELPADLVVCATGFRIASPPLYVHGDDAQAGGAGAADEGAPHRPGDDGAPHTRRRLCDVESEQPLLYRSMVLPQTPRVAAVLYNSMGINAMFSAELMATWLAAFYASGRAEGAEGTDLRALVEADALPLRELGGGEPFNNWHFWRSGETAGGRGYASDYYEEQIYKDLGMELPSRSLALLRLQHDEHYYQEAAASFEEIARDDLPARGREKREV